MMLSKIKAYFIGLHFAITVAVVIGLMYLFPKKNHAIRRGWAKLEKFLIGYKINKKGSPNKKSQLLIINHQSILDIVTLEAIYPQNISWIAKQEIEDIPFFGHIMKAPKMISVKRDDKRSILKLIKDVKNRVQSGRVIAIFPEGTRGDGKNLLPFHLGAKIIAEKLNLLVQPIVICGSKEVLDSQNFTAKGDKIVVNYLPCVNPKEDKWWYEKLKDNMQRVLNDELANSFSNR